MTDSNYQMFDDKVILRIRDRLCETPTELVASPMFGEILSHCIDELTARRSRLLGVFPDSAPTPANIVILRQALSFLTKLPADLVIKVVDGAEPFFADRALLNDFVEHFYNYWRAHHRLIICSSRGGQLDQRPYRTFNNTIEKLTGLVRSTYRDVQENITGSHPRIYRQVRAGAEVATIALPKDIPMPGGSYDQLAAVPIIRQVLIYPPLIFNPPTNTRSGSFERVPSNPLDHITVRPEEWLCYPARVGELVVLVYFTLPFFELAFSMCNLFELADDADLQRQPDAIYLFGAPAVSFPRLGKTDTIFYDGYAGEPLVGAVPNNPRYGYFGYLKKMVLTLHNIHMMKNGRLPYHGAMVNLAIRERGNFTVLIVGDTGAGKSETLEALRTLAGEDLQDITIIADDMGSLALHADGSLSGYGTETGAFVRLDDLQPGFAFGQIDRTILMSPAQTNARVIVPVTTYDNIVRGFAPDMVLYANNYEDVNDGQPILERFTEPAGAMAVFQAGQVMSKGTTSTSGLVGAYFANIFGPEQYPDLHQPLAERFFQAFFDQGIYVGQLRTRLGMPGFERLGPEAAAAALLEQLKTL